MSVGFTFELLAPDRLLASHEAREVSIPGAEGDLTALPGHAPLIIALRPGVLRVVASDGEEIEYVLTGGFAEIAAGSATVLAEWAMARSSVTSDMLGEHIAVAEAESNTLEGTDKDRADKILADMNALAGILGS